MYAQIALIIAKIFSAILTYFQEKKLITAGEAIASLSILTKQHDALVRANEIRKKADSEFTSDPSSVLHDDGFKRKD
jgi:hypothetical protein